VVTGGMGGGGVVCPESASVLWGGSFDTGGSSALGVLELDSSEAGGSSGRCLEGGVALGSTGGGAGRVAEGASGMSSVFCCAHNPLPASKTNTHRIANPDFFAIARHLPFRPDSL